MLIDKLYFCNALEGRYLLSLNSSMLNIISKTHVGIGVFVNCILVPFGGSFHAHIKI